MKSRIEKKQQNLLEEIAKYNLYILECEKQLEEYREKLKKLLNELDNLCIKSDK